KKNVASEFIVRLLEHNMVSPNLLLGINVIYPGIVDRTAKKMIYSAIVTSRDLLNNSEVESLQEQYPNAVVMINNHSSVTAYAEYAFNDYEYNRTLVSVNIFEAVGAGAIFINDKGEKTIDLPLELGHMIVEKEGPVCKCGNRGCLEAMVGICSIFKKIEMEANISLEYYDEFDHIKNIACMKTVAKMVEDGNQAVIRVLDEAADWIAVALTNMNNIIDPGYIYIGGTIRHLGEDFLNRIREKMKKLNLKHTDFPSIISYSRLDGEERLKGGIAMMMDDIFSAQDG
ncbi:MAG: ROK family protein, partial [Eubacteriales bacterium]